ncbi:MAG: NAD(P)H-dependent oxidoreductase [Rhizobiaceae bacterium]|nr:NAD(P)H-dependent oxidoreductase [Rhizobiaceae bacterium]
MSKPKIGIIVGSTRDTRFADKPAAWIAKIAKERTDLDFEIVDVRDYNLPFFNEVASNAWVPSKSEAAQKWQKKIGSLDGFLIVAAEYNRSPTASLKNALDHAYVEWNKKPVAFVGYGAVGAARAIEQLRTIAVELQMAPTRTAVHIAGADFMAVWQQGKNLEDFEHLNQSARDTIGQLAWWTHALTAARRNDAVAAQAA